MRLAVLLIVFIPVTALAVQAPTPEIIATNAELFNWIVSVGLVVLGYFLNRTITSMERNSERQWAAIIKLDNRLSHLEGEHKVNHKDDKK